MWDDREAVLIVDPVERLVVVEAGGDQLPDTEREHVAGGARDLHPGNADEAVVVRQLGGLQTRVELVVVGDRERVEAHGGRLFEKHIDGVSAVMRER